MVQAVLKVQRKEEGMEVSQTICCKWLPIPSSSPRQTRQAHDRFVVSPPSGPSPPCPPRRHTKPHTATHMHDKIRMKSPCHPAMQAAEPFSDPAGTHCAGATDGANVGVDASLHHRVVWSLNGPLWLGQLACLARQEHAHMHTVTVAKVSNSSPQRIMSKQYPSSSGPPNPLHPIQPKSCRCAPHMSGECIVSHPQAKRERFTPWTTMR